MITGSSIIKYWIENELESNDISEMPQLHERPITYIKNAFIWALYYLKNEIKLDHALKDILKKGGDTTANAAIVGGLLGAAFELQNIDER